MFRSKVIELYQSGKRAALDTFKRTTTKPAKKYYHTNIATPVARKYAANASQPINPASTGITRLKVKKSTLTAAASVQGTVSSHLGDLTPRASSLSNRNVASKPKAEAKALSTIQCSSLSRIQSSLMMAPRPSSCSFAVRYMSTDTRSSESDIKVETPPTAEKPGQSSNLQPEVPKTKNFNDKKSSINFGSMCGLLYAGVAMFALYKLFTHPSVAGPREKPIIFSLEQGKLKKSGVVGRSNEAAKIEQAFLQLGCIVDSNTLTVIGEKTKGQLSGYIVESTTDGICYVQKGAKSYETFLNEALIGQFLNMINPEIQPRVAVLAQPCAGKAGDWQLFNLSEKRPNSMDLEDFLRLPDWRKKLAEKPLIGLEQALAMDAVCGNQQEMKLSNYIITETQDAFVISSIDHEFVGIAMVSNPKCTTDLDSLLHMICDLDLNLSDLPLAGHPSVYEFIKLARPSMREENVRRVFERVVQVDLAPLVEVAEKMDKSHGSHAGVACIAELRSKQTMAQDYLNSHPVTAVSARRPH